jgi:hypothetical protein
VTLSDLAEFGKVFGLPGLVIVAWFLLQRDTNRRNEKLEEQKIGVEREKANAMTVGFQSLSGQISTHQSADLASHREMAEGLAELHGKIDQALIDRTPVESVRRVTPPRGVQAGEYGYTRPKTGGR